MQLGDQVFIFCRARSHACVRNNWNYLSYVSEVGDKT
jgi:hypothetical protein